MRLPQWFVQWCRRTSLALVLLAASAVRIPAQQVELPARVTLAGSVHDTVSGAAVRLATVRVTGTTISVLTDDAGHFRIVVPLGQVALEVRQIGFLPARRSVVVTAGLDSLTFYLQRVAVQLTPITVTAFDDPAERLIRGAIVRKRAMFATIHDYSYLAYVKLAVRDLERHPVHGRHGPGGRRPSS